MMVDVVEPSLTELAATGDLDAFTKLLRQHDDRMRAVAYRMVGSGPAMDDVLQVAYLNAHRGLARFRRDAEFGTWLHRIVVNAALDHLRQLDRRAEVSLEQVPELTRSGSLEDELVLANTLHRALAELPPDFRAAVVLVDGEGMSYAEAADLLGVERGTVASRLNRARSLLRQRLSAAERGDDERGPGESEARS